MNTPAVFGNYIDVYDISRAVEDGATVPIYYESRLARIELDEDEKPKIDAEIDELTEDDPEVEQERFKRKWSTVEALVGSDKRLRLVADDMVRHFEDRVAALDGKAMVVCMSRRICVKLYDEIVKLRPQWHSTDDNAGSVKIVMTGAASDPQEWQQHIGNKARRDLLAKRARDPKDPLRLAAFMASISFMPATIVRRETPVAADTAEIPPRPKTWASTPTNSRLWRSLSVSCRTFQRCAIGDSVGMHPSVTDCYKMYKLFIYSP